MQGKFNKFEAIKKIKEDGFFLLKNLITKKQALKYKNNFEELYSQLHKRTNKAKKGSDSILADKSLEKTVYNLHNKGMIWFDLFLEPKIHEIIEPLLKAGSYQDSEDYYLYNISARTPLKGGGYQQLHTDSNLPGCNYTMVINVLWALEDFTLENGATRLVPKSHKKKAYPRDNVIDENEIVIECEAGDALIFDGAIHHGSGENLTDKTRWALALGYARWFYKPSFDYMFNTPKKVFDKLNNSQKKVLGFHLVPPTDEFTRTTRKSNVFEEPYYLK